jgi:hypothetical protein
MRIINGKNTRLALVSDDYPVFGHNASLCIYMTWANLLTLSLLNIVKDQLFEQWPGAGRAG